MNVTYLNKLIDAYIALLCFDKYIRIMGILAERTIVIVIIMVISMFEVPFVCAQEFSKMFL